MEKDRTLSGAGSSSIALAFLAYVVLFGPEVLATTAPTIDPTFNPDLVSLGYSSAQGAVAQPDGRFVVGGVFNAIDFTNCSTIVRLNPDGSRDSNFRAAQLLPVGGDLSNIPGSIIPFAVQPNGQILVRGKFSTADAVHEDLVRLNPDGSVDPAFTFTLKRTASIEPNDYFPSIGQALLQSDGRILIAGVFDEIDGIARPMFARVNGDGTLDTEFNPDFGGLTPRTFAVQNDGKIVAIVAGFESGKFLVRITRVDSDGSVDPTFQSYPLPPSIYSFSYTILAQSDGKILVGNADAGANFPGLFRLNGDGTTDASFNAVAQPARLFAIQVDGKALVTTDSVTLQRLNTDGTFDSTFQQAADPSGQGISSVATQLDGTVGVLRESTMTRLSSDGSVDPRFHQSVFVMLVNPSISLVRLQFDGKILIGGGFNYVDRVPRRNLARLNRDGSLDESFDAGESFVNGAPLEVLEQPDGRLLIASNPITRLYPNGKRDPTFDASGFHPNWIRAVALQSDGKLVVAPDTGFARLNADGSIDPSFSSPAGGNFFLSNLYITPDGKVLANSSFGPLRLNSDGSRDATFNPDHVHFTICAALLNGQLLALNDGGDLVRLRADGTLDPSFHSFHPTFYPSVVAPDHGGIILGGGINFSAAESGFLIVRLFDDGTQDPNFNDAFHFLSLTGATVQPDGKILAYFDIGAVPELKPPGILRLIGDANSRLANISTRAIVGKGATVAITGFIVTGSAPKRVVLRAIGPSLVSSGISETLSDPSLELHDAVGTLIAHNDDWRVAQEAEIIATGLAPENDREAAIVTTLQPGQYTAVLNGRGENAGIALIEAYDLDGAIGSQFANVSTRGLAETDSNAMIAGLILDGATPVKVLLRAIGPTLANSGVDGALQDPVLEVHDSNGVILASNDNWRDASNSAEIQSSGLAPNDDRESAILLTLSAGNYTSIVRGVNRTTGVALAEAYKFDN